MRRASQRLTKWGEISLKSNLSLSTSPITNRDGEGYISEYLIKEWSKWLSSPFSIPRSPISKKKTESLYAALAGLASRVLPAYLFIRSARIIDEHHHTWPRNSMMKDVLVFKSFSKSSILYIFCRMLKLGHDKHLPLPASFLLWPVTLDYSFACFSCEDCSRCSSRKLHLKNLCVCVRARARARVCTRHTLHVSRYTKRSQNWTRSPWSQLWAVWWGTEPN